MASLIGAGFVTLGIVYLAASAAIARQQHKSLLLLKSVTAASFTGVGAICAGLAYFQAAAGQPFNTVYKARAIATLSIPPLIRACFELRGRARLGRIIEATTFAFWASAVTLNVATDWIDEGAVSLVPFVDRVSPREQGLRAMLTVTLLWALVELYRTHRATEGLARRQIAYFFTGIAIYALGAMAVAASAIWLGRGALDPAFALLFSVPWIALTLYSATRYRLFEVGYLFSRTFAGLAVVASAALGGLLLYRVMTPHIAATYATVSATALVTLLLIASANLRAELQRRVVRLFGYHTDVERDAAPLPAGLSLKDLGPRLVEATSQHLGTRPVALYLRRRQGGYALAHGLDLPADAPSKVDDASPPVTWLRREQELLIVEEQRLFGASDLASEVSDALAPIEVAIVAPIASGPRVEGLLVLGPKLDREAYTQDELDWLLALTARAALAVENLRLYAALDEAINDLDAFVRSAAHDLRTPLRAIDNLAGFAFEDITADPDAVPEHLDAIRKRARRMEALLDGIERYLRARPNPHAASEPVALDALVARIAKKRLPQAFRVELEVEAVHLHTLAAPLEMVLDELIDNAARHHDRADGEVRVHAGVDDGVLHVAVTDDGPGIAAAYQQKIFVLFQTLERRDLTEASGIGLALCRKVVQHQGGSLDVTSSGRGATFHLAWPLETA